MDVSIIVVAWNVRDFVYNCLKSVFEETKGIKFEAIYVDNGSEDDSIEMVKNEFPEVKIIENSENLGFIKANNQGIKIARGRYVLLLNSDTIILDNAIAKTVGFADGHQEAAVVGCKVLNPDKSLQRSCFMYPSILNAFLSATYLYKVFPKSRFFAREEMTWWDFDDVREVETIKGCFSLVRMEAIKQVGLMDELLFVYGDDIDWCYRFVKKGWKVLFTPEQRIIHFGGQTTKKTVSKFQHQLFGSVLIFVKKHYSYPTFLVYRFLTSLHFFIRTPYWFIVGIAREKERENAFQLFRSYLLGGFYSITDWKNLLMNKDIVKDKLR
jgi:hypothetical protein